MPLINQYFENYGLEFLKINNLKIGDIVEAEFSYNYLRSKYKQSGHDCYFEKKRAKGVLKLGASNCLLIESVDDFSFYHQESNGFSGRSYKTWYVETKRKSIIKLGTTTLTL